ncbi:hypothetical protein BJX66DRAFT_308892 [Aspergillus keveii]|uniref:Calcofluor white hypersensitive protein n=1 Tax=Aspergillus keveii TaxID=714993 RepID=A0ABR4FYY3_9EURO
MAAPAKSRTGLYLGLGAVGAGAYYLYRAGGNPKAAKEEMKYDVNKARAKAPGAVEGERAGETAGLETNLNLDEAANNPRTRNNDLTAQAQRKLDEVSQAGKEQASKVRSEVEEKASEAKSTVSGWFGGKK